jgi:hypothetical protein
MSQHRNRPERARAQPHRLAYEQEEERVHHDEMAQLLAAIRLSTQHSRGAESESDGDGESEAEDDEEEEEPEEEEEETEADEKRDESGLTEKERLQYAKLQEKEEKFGWSRERSQVDIHPFQPPSSPPLLASEIAECKSPLDFFHIILPPSFFEHIAEQINTYAEQRDTAVKENQPQDLNQPTQHRSKWHESSTAEVLAFAGCVVFMGIVVTHDSKYYWSATIGAPFIFSTFPRLRFFQLLRSFHLADNLDPDPDTQSDLLRKIRPLIDTVRMRSQRAHYPGRQLTVDEAMVGFKGRSSMRQHIAKKTQDTGFKVWMLVECDTNYVFNFDIYTGKGGKSETGQSARVVTQLCERLHPHIWHIICTDGFFSSVSLFRSLYEKGIYALGTTRHKRLNFPVTLMYDNRRLQRGQCVFRQKDNLQCVSWMDKKPVNFLSTCCDVGRLETVQRRKRKAKEKERVSCPEVVKEYHRWMRGVDVFSQRESYSRIGRRSRKWWPRLAWFLIDIAISNSYVLYTQHIQQSASRIMTHKQFRKALMTEMVGAFTVRKKRGRPATHKLAADELHIPQHRSQHQPCVVCAKKQRLASGEHKPRTREGCETCDVAVHIKCWREHMPHQSHERGDGSTDDEGDDGSQSNEGDDVAVDG